MKRGRRPLVDEARARMLDLWVGKESFGKPIGCVATTFTFDAELFEEQCLARFLSIESHPTETAKAYLIEREEKLSQSFACVLVDRGHAAANRSLRWHQLPISLPGGGVLHAKISLLVWQNCIRVLIGSANLSEHGLRRNQEVVAAWDFSDQGSDVSPALLEQSVAFLEALEVYAPNSLGVPGPRGALREFLAGVRRRIPSLPISNSKEAECALVPLLPGGANVIDQIGRHWRGPAPNSAWILSPFFDDEDKAAKTVESFSALLTNRGERFLHFTAPGREMPNKVVQIDAPSSLLRSDKKSAVAHTFSFVDQQVKVGDRLEERPLHAKAIWLARDDRAFYLLGSSNFTAAGLGLHPRHNIELNVAYVIKDASSPFAKRCESSWPEDKDLDGRTVEFLGSASDSADGNDVVLPMAFGSALFSLNEKGPHLQLDIAESAPSEFTVRTIAAEVILTGSAWRERGMPKTITVPWKDARPPSSLDVQWVDSSRERRSAPWIVNVQDMEALPPPEELSNLSLSELMAILSSARPLHETITRILKQREKRRTDTDRPEVDPLQRVDTSRYLLQRMRSVGRALEGMKRRLEQPVSSRDALRWRLNGPVGPLALAGRLISDDQNSAAFMIAEIASTVKEAQWLPVGSLRASQLQPEVRRAIEELQSMAVTVPVSQPLASYVTSVFEEILV